MILYFPKAYPDELLYSQLARYYIKSGYTAYRFAAEALYKNKTIDFTMAIFLGAP